MALAGPRLHATREALLSTAIGLFAIDGVPATSVPAITREAGVAIGTFYHHFTSKEQLVNELYRTWKQALARCLLDGLAAEPGVRAQFLHVWSRLGEFARHHGRELAFLELHNHRPYLDVASRAVEQEMLDQLRALVVSWQRAGALTPTPVEQLIAMVWGAFVGLLRASQLGYLVLDQATLRSTGELQWRAVASSGVAR